MCVCAGIDIHPMTLEINFKLPFMREFLLLHGVVDASKTACLMVLGKGSGQAILLAVGGAQEALLAQPGTYDVVRQTGHPVQACRACAGFC
jgi:2-acylglycerol O-acyltransferase 2